MMHLRHAIPNMVHRDDSKYQKDVIQVKKKCYFRPISGVRNFENFISGFRKYHQKTQNLILGGVLGGIFEIQECFVPKKVIFDLFDEKTPARMVTFQYKY